MPNTLTRNPLDTPGVRCALVALLLVALWLATPAAVADSSGRCVSVEVDAQIVLPDGEIHPSGRLTLCNSQRVTPVSTVHKTYINGELVGVHLGQQKSSESKETMPLVFFYRNGIGQLELYGYVFPSRDGDVTYTLAEQSKQRIRPGGTGPELVANQRASQLVAVATAPASR